MGMERFVLIDFDEIQRHNLDRLLGADPDDLGRLKVDVAVRQIMKAATAGNVEVVRVPFSLAEEPGYRAALDCDVLFSCVDRPRARSIVNHLAYAHLIPVVDGGVAVRFRNGRFIGAEWQLQTVGPNRPCLECLGTFTRADAETERAGMLDDPSYMQGLSDDHPYKRNENVFPFSANLASLEVLQFIALVTGAAGVDTFGVQRFRYNPGTIDQDVERECKEGCEVRKSLGQGDKFELYGRDFGAEAARIRQSETLNSILVAQRTSCNRSLNNSTVSRLLACGLAPVAVRVADLALGDLCLDVRDADPRHMRQRRDLVASDMIELKDYRVCLTAVHTPCLQR